MAQMFPPEISPASPDSEKATFRAFSRLDDDWQILHSVRWQNMRDGKIGDGECDFVMLHPTKGAHIAEVKGGGFELVDGEWYSKDANGRKKITSPFEQIVKSKYALLSYLESLKGVPSADFTHVAVLPDIVQEGPLGPDAPRETIWDMNDLDNIEAAVDALAAHWNRAKPLNTKNIKKIREALLPSVSVRPLKTRAAILDVSAEQLQLTQEQFFALIILLNQLIAIITGGAGTGKTLLAVERARQLEQQGLKVLVLCFNKALGTFLGNQFEDNEGIVAKHFHGYAAELIKRAGLKPNERGSEYFNNLPSHLHSASGLTSESFDALIVDEGQDFEPTWWAPLKSLLASEDESIINVFADANQDLYRRDWQPPFEAGAFPLDKNCRNTVEIAAKANAALDLKEPSEGVSGPRPEYLIVKSFDESIDRLEARLERLLEEGVEPHEIVVLSPSKKVVDELRGLHVGDERLVEFDSGKKGIEIATVQTFKGLERDAVVLVLDNLINSKVNDELDEQRLVELRRLAYVGISRAKAVLLVIGSNSAKKAIRW